MPSLEELLLPNNLLDWLPKELADLKLLRRLDVSRNPLTSPPVEVAARGLDSVKRYFCDVESKTRDDSGSAEERHVEVPNQVKVIFIGHSEAGKSQVIKGLESTRAALPHLHGTTGINTSTSTSTSIDDKAFTRSFSTPANYASGGSSIVSSRNSTPTPSRTSPVFPSTAAASTPGAPHQQNRRHAPPPRTPPQPPLPAQDDEGWQVVGTARQRSLRVPSTPPPNRLHGLYETPPSYGVRTPGGPGASAGGGGRRWETVGVQAGSDLGWGQGSGAGGTNAGARGEWSSERSMVRPGLCLVLLVCDGRGKMSSGSSRR